MVAVFVAAAVILAAAQVIFDRNLALSDVALLALFIAIAAIILLRLTAFFIAARDL